MMESLLLFDSVVNSRWFMRTSIILFLNKVDIFKQKLSRSPMANYFPDYSGGDDVHKAAKYLLWRFNQVNRAHLHLYPQYVSFSACLISHCIRYADQEMIKSHTSDRHIQYPARLRGGQGNNTKQCTKRCWYSLRSWSSLAAAAAVDCEHRKRNDSYVAL